MSEVATIEQRSSNHPPELVEDTPVGLLPWKELQAALPKDHADLIARKDELLAGAARFPEVIDETNDEDCSDAILQLNRAAKKVDSAREQVKAPYWEVCGGVQAWFKGIETPLTDMATKLGGRMTAYGLVKAAREKKRLADIAQKARDDAAAAAAEAAAIEKRAADDLALKRRDAERAEEIARAVAQTRIERTPEGPKREALIEIEAERRAEAAAALLEIGANIPPDPEAEKLRDAATQRAAEAERATARAASPIVGLSRTRGSGSVSSIRTEWKGAIIDIKLIPWAVLGPFISPEHAQIAVNRYVAAGHRELAGCRIFEDHTNQTR